MSRLLALVLLALTGTAPAAGLAADIGRIKAVAGDAAVVRAGERLPARPGMALSREDTLVTGSDGRLGITFADSSRFALGPDTEIRLDTFQFDPTTHEGRFVSSIARGRLSVISGRMAKHAPDAMQVRTPSRILGVRGTEFLVKVAP